METKYERVPFEMKLARCIHRMGCDGRIVTKEGRPVRIICWDAERDDRIVALVKDKTGKEDIVSFYENGSYILGEDSESDLILEIPDKSKFEDGDYVIFGDSEYIGIFKSYSEKSKGLLDCYVVREPNGQLVFNNDTWVICDSRPATFFEIDKLLKSLYESKDDLAKDYLDKFFCIDTHFNPKDWVLVRSSLPEQWHLTRFSHLSYNDWLKRALYYCVDSRGYVNCIPYEGNEHLLGTTDNP